mmetsp:Transcript_38918/g.85550  ORF Transcript_38918/g.85550 Transcript_38918/m.85550 type:complete len:222 (-) Transcript_38918:789-1454(-)
MRARVRRLLRRRHRVAAATASQSLGLIRTWIRSLRTRCASPWRRSVRGRRRRPRELPQTAPRPTAPQARPPQRVETWRWRRMPAQHQRRQFRLAARAARLTRRRSCRLRSPCRCPAARPPRLRRRRPTFITFWRRTCLSAVRTSSCSHHCKQNLNKSKARHCGRFSYCELDASHSNEPLGFPVQTSHRTVQVHEQLQFRLAASHLSISGCDRQHTLPGRQP